MRNNFEKIDLNHYFKQVSIAESSGTLTGVIFTKDNGTMELFKFDVKSYYDKSIYRNLQVIQTIDSKADKQNFFTFFDYQDD